MIINNLQEFYQLLPPNAPLIAVDYGSKKCGIAMSNQERSIAMPLSAIVGVKRKVQFVSLLSIIEEYKAGGIVIGLPVNVNGELKEQAEIVMNFAKELAAITNLPIYLQDERFTTKAANSFLKSFGIKRKERNNKNDTVAASMILDTVLTSIKRF